MTTAEPLATPAAARLWACATTTSSTCPHRVGTRLAIALGICLDALQGR